MSFSFGSTTPKTTSPFTLGSSATPATTASTGLTFGGFTPGSTTGFSLGSGDSSKLPAQTAAIKPIASAAPLPSTFPFGSPSTTPATTTTAAATPGFTGFGLTPAATSVAPQAPATGFSFASVSATTPSTVTTTTSTGTFRVTPSTTSSLQLGVTSAPTLGLGQTTTTTTSSTAQPLAVPATATQPSNLITFVQLEESFKKWKNELEEQEKIFLSQAAQISKWDELLKSNSEKILELNKEVDCMKVLQQQLDHELEFISAQQRELEEALVPLEKQAAEMPSNTDPEREHTYHMAESLDSQLKQMSEDLRDIIEEINASSRTQDSTDPIVQIGKILNSHMNSLYWIDMNILNIQNQLDNVSKLHDNHRRESERSFRISYE